MNAGKVGDTIIGILIAIVGVAILSVLVSSNAQTPQVLKAAGSTLAGVINAALVSTGG